MALSPVHTSLELNLTFRIPGVVAPFYIHTPTMYVYEQPIITSYPLGLYSLQSGMLNMNSNFYNSSLGAEYRSMGVQTPYSAAALAWQGATYPATSMAVSNELVYPSNYEYQRPLALGYGSGSRYGSGYGSGSGYGGYGSGSRYGSGSGYGNGYYGQQRLLTTF